MAKTWLSAVSSAAGIRRRHSMAAAASVQPRPAATSAPAAATSGPERQIVGTSGESPGNGTPAG